MSQTDCVRDQARRDPNETAGDLAKERGVEIRTRVVIGDNVEVEFVDLLREMNRDAALSCWSVEVIDGKRIRSWSAISVATISTFVYAFHDDFRSLLAELFVEGKLTFWVRTWPPLGILWFRIRSHEVAQIVN